MYLERVDDLPVLIEMMKKVQLPETLDRHLGRHRLHRGLSNGWLAVIWLAYIMTEGRTDKESVRKWVGKRRATLEGTIGQAIREVDLSNDRLTILLRRMSPRKVREALDGALWKGTVAVYEVPVEAVRVDMTTAGGYHTVKAGGVMQRGHAKNHRNDLPQLKLVAAAAEPSGQLAMTGVAGGEKADDPLYLPIIARVRQLLGRSGLLYVGDCKMAKLETRADIASHEDHYLVPLPRRQAPEEEVAAWVEAAVAGEMPATLVAGREDAEGRRPLIAAGYELEQRRSAEINGEGVEWAERVLIIRSAALARCQAARLEKQLDAAEKALWALTPAPAPGKTQIREEADLRAKVDEVLGREDVTGLLHVAWEQDLSAAGCGGKRKPKPPRYAITQVQRDQAAIAAREHRMGWRPLATSMPAGRMSLPQCVLQYRQGWCLERDFHLVKDRPLGISPILVHRDDQIIGKTYLLTLALRLRTLIEIQVRRVLADTGEQLTGMYPGNPGRGTARPTVNQLLRAFVGAQITLTYIQWGGQTAWSITPLTPTLERILACLGLSPAIYTRLAGGLT